MSDIGPIGPSGSMDERESYVELIYITVGKFKEEAESNLDHMRSLLRLSGPPFQRVSRGEVVAMAESSQAGGCNGQGANDTQDEAESSQHR